MQLGYESAVSNLPQELKCEHLPTPDEGEEEGMRLKASQTLAQRILQPNQNWRRCVLEWVHTTAVKSRKTHTLGGFLNNIQPQSQLGLSAPRCWEDVCRNPMFIQELVSS